MTLAGEQMSDQEMELPLRMLRTALVGQDPVTEEAVRATAEKWLSHLTGEVRRQVVQRWLDDRVELGPPTGAAP